MKEKYEREQLAFCPNCGIVVSGDNEGIVLGYYSYLSNEADFSIPQNEEIKEKYGLVKKQQNELVSALEQQRKTLEDIGWTRGKYYKKICKTLKYARSYTMTFKEKIESGEFYEE